MKSIWGKPLSTVILICALALLVWPILGVRDALLLLSVLCLALLLHHLRNLSDLYRWVQDPKIDTLPSGSGARTGKRT